MLWIPVNRQLDIALNRQLYEQIRERILSGELRSGDKLPSTRELAKELQLSRNVVLEAYDQLLAEGFLMAERGSGTYVAEGAYLEDGYVSRSAVSYAQATEETGERTVIDFRSGIPALDAVPRKSWGKLSREAWLDTPPAAFGYGVPEGRLELRRALAQYLSRTRGVRCLPEQIVMTSGATQALTLAARLLLTAGDPVLIEDPITRDIQSIFSQAGAELHPLPTDEQGMMTALLPHNIHPAFIFITPSHQFPLGGTLSIQRRIQLVHYARERDCYLVEDDYDIEFRHEGPPISSLQGLEPERVLYIGSFSKILSPALRLGYLVLPRHLVEACRSLKWFSDLHTSSLDQLVLSRYIENGGLERHIGRMKKLYRGRRDVLLRSLKEAFGDTVEITGQSTGLHFIASFQGIRFTEELLAELLDYGVKVYPVEYHARVKGAHEHRLILGYGHLDAEQLREGIRRLKRGMSELGLCAADGLE